ncbi:tRNA methyl transferase-domain-containing protein [Tirmania nivea]|nr:tRNA methyl transferase-domain-containing protein [Tirmania nivea]
MARVRYQISFFSTRGRNGISRRQCSWCFHLQQGRAYNSHSLPHVAPRPSPNDIVYVALSSGIDSSVTAKLLSLTHPPENLYPLYMTNWNPSSLTRADLLIHRRPPRDKPSLFHLQDKPKLTTQTRASKEEKCTTREFRLVQELCSFLGLRDPLHMNFEKEYWTEVFEPMVASYERGETPNPDVGCNRWVKFGGLLRRLEEMEARSGQGRKGQWWLATGHYANIGYPLGKSAAEPHLLRSPDPNKDQTYFLSTLTPECLSKLIFPLAANNLSKPQVYELARKYRLPGWAPGSPERSESMGLCFVEPGGGGQGTTGFRVFLSEFLESSPGEVVVGPELPTPAGVVLEGQEGRPKNDTIGAPPRGRSKKFRDSEEEGHSEKSLTPGTIIGQHQGLWTATVGEKAHLNLPQGDIRYQGRWYISSKNAATNQMEVVRGWGNGRLWSTGIVVQEFYWLGSDCEAVALNALSPAPLMGSRVKAHEAEVVVDHAVFEEAEDATEYAAEITTKEQIWEERLVLQFRHRQKPLRVASVEVMRQRQEAPLQAGHVKIMFETPQRAVTPGQNAAMWWGERCLGGGVIDTVIQKRMDSKDYNGSAEVKVASLDQG